METKLAGKVVMVTGASGGIGSAIARGFAAEGALVVLHGNRGKARLQALQKELGRSHTLAICTDLTNDAAVGHLFARVLKRFGRIDTLIANAGAWEVEDVPLHKMPFTRWRRTMDGLLNTTFLSVREFFRIVAQQQQGNAVLIASTAAVFGEAGHADYAAAKAAIAYGLTRTLKNEITRIAPHTSKYCGGRVNCISPGWTLVPRLEAKLKQTEMIRRTAATMALPQFARPEDIASAAVFLSSDVLARHITGQTLVIAGGMEGRQLWNPDEVDPGIV